MEIFRNNLACLLMALLSTTEPSFIEIGATTRAASRRGVDYVWNDPTGTGSGVAISEIQNLF